MIKHRAQRLVMTCIVAIVARSAAAGPSLDLRACYDLAAQHSDTVAISAEEIFAAQARYLQTLGDVLPTISAQATEFLQQRSGDATLSNSFTRRHRPEVVVTLTQPLFQRSRCCAHGWGNWNSGLRSGNRVSASN